MPARGDLADLRLADKLFAPHYAAAVLRTAVAHASLSATFGGEPLSEILPGEGFEVLELSGGQAWGMSAVDGAVGFVAVEALDAPFEATHIVRVPMAGDLPMGTRLSADQAAAADPVTIQPLGMPVGDFVTMAESLVGAPARAGGRSGAGVNCTGLVFLTLSLAGIRAPRFADLQAASLGHAVGDDAPMLRGDLLFFADHAAIVADSDTAIHVDAAGEQVVRESIASIIEGGAFGPLTVRRRLP